MSKPQVTGEEAAPDGCSRPTKACTVYSGAAGVSNFPYPGCVPLLPSLPGYQRPSRGAGHLGTQAEHCEAALMKGGTTAGLGGCG